MDNARKDYNQNIIIVFALIVAVMLFFGIFECAYMPRDYSNLGGKHAWVSGSTIKYVNMWLEEGAANLHFTNYELFASVELESMADRMPYVSYPTGVTFMVWAGARICGMSHIDVSFLKHFQLVMYAVESVLMALLLYVCFCKMTKLKRYADAILAFVMTSIWISLPVNNWFMTNIYWTDIAVFVWILAFLLLESISDLDIYTKGQRYAVLILKSLVILAGVLTEYYFWIVVFAAFVADVVGKICATDKGQKIRKAIISSLQYIIPVFVGLGLYVWQMTYTEDWLKQLEETFLHRTGASNDEASFEMFTDSFCNAIACDSRIRALMLMLLLVFFILIIIIAISRGKKWHALINCKCAVVLAVLIVTPIVQLTLFSNHSAIHQYSLVKVGLVIVGCLCALICSLLENRVKRFRVGICVGAVIATLLLLGYPVQSRQFYENKNSMLNYDIAGAIYDHTGYDDICFSYTYVVSNNPPMDICVTEKQVYEIEKAEDIYIRAEKLPQEANLILVIDKDNIGSNDYIDRDKSEYILEQEEKCMNEGVILYEDDTCALVKLPR